jgi:hypothetical protein
MVLLWVFRDEWAFFYAPNSEIIRDIMFESLPYFILGNLIMDGI